MKIVCSSRGSRGDVAPVLEIARALTKAGHEVIACVPPLFEPDAAAVCGDVRTTHEDSAAVMRELGSGWGAAVNALRWFARDVEDQIHLLLDAAADADALVTSVNELGAPTVAEALGIPRFRVAYAPVLPGDQPPPLLPWQHLPRWGNRLAWQALNGAAGLAVDGLVNGRRRAMGLQPVRDVVEYFAGDSHTLLAYSPELAPPDRSWPWAHTTTGYCHGPAGPPLDERLSRWLEAGPPPVYLGFGSVFVNDPRRMTDLVLRAARRARCRVVIGAGWTGLGAGDTGSQVRVIGPTPHDRLFPKMAAVVHHGGCGTTHVALRAGVPQAALPQLADQFFWGSRIADERLGPAPIPPKDLDGRRLAALLVALTRTPTYRRRARELARRVAQEPDGAHRCAEIILRSCRSRRRAVA